MCSIPTTPNLHWLDILGVFLQPKAIGHRVSDVEIQPMASIRLSELIGNKGLTVCIVHGCTKEQLIKIYQVMQIDR